MNAETFEIGNTDVNFAPQATEAGARITITPDDTSYNSRIFGTCESWGEALEGYSAQTYNDANCVRVEVHGPQGTELDGYVNDLKERLQALGQQGTQTASKGMGMAMGIAGSGSSHGLGYRGSSHNPQKQEGEAVEDLKPEEVQT